MPYYSYHSYYFNALKKEDKINKGEHRSKKVTPTTFSNRKHLKGWAKIPIPKQIEDEKHDIKQTYKQIGDEEHDMKQTYKQTNKGRRTRHEADLQTNK